MLLGLHFILLHVADIEEAAAFYTEKFGLTIEDQNPMFVQFKPGVGGGAVLALSQGESKPDAGTELWWFVDNVDATLADLQAKVLRWSILWPTSRLAAPVPSKLPAAIRFTYSNQLSRGRRAIVCGWQGISTRGCPAFYERPPFFYAAVNRRMMRALASSGASSNISISYHTC